MMDYTGQFARRDLSFHLGRQCRVSCAQTKEDHLTPNAEADSLLSSLSTVLLTDVYRDAAFSQGVFYT